MSSSSVDMSEDAPIAIEMASPAHDEIPPARSGTSEERDGLLLMADTAAAAIFHTSDEQGIHEASAASYTSEDDRGRTAQSLTMNEFEEKDAAVGSTVGSSPPSALFASLESSQHPQGLRTSSRIKKTPCPICGQYFFELEKHAATCEGPISPSGSITTSNGTEGGTGSRKPKRSRSPTPNPNIGGEMTAVTTHEMAFQPIEFDNDSSSRISAFLEQPRVEVVHIVSNRLVEQQHHGPDQVQIITPPNTHINQPTLPKSTPVTSGAPSAASKRKRIVPNKSSAIPSMPPPLNAPPPTLDANKDVIQRERALFAAAAAAAAAAAGASVSSSSDAPQSASVFKAKNVELVEIEPGVTIFVSEHPMREGQGQGSEYTLRTQISWLVEELHSVRESDSFVRTENEKLRKGMEEVLARIEEQRKGMEELESLRSELLAKQEEAESLRAQLEMDRTSLGELEKATTVLHEELRALRGALNTTKTELSTTKGQATRAKNEQAKTKKELDDMMVRVGELGKELEAKSGEVEQLGGELATRSMELENATTRLASRTTECEDLRVHLEAKSSLVTDLNKQMEAKSNELNAAKKDLETTKAELAKVKAEMEQQASLIQKGPNRKDSLSPLSPDDDLEMMMTRPFDPLEMEAQMMALMAPVDDSLARDAEEYLQLLTQWLLTHKNALPSSAVAVFHGTKPRAKELWQAITSSRVPAMTVREFLGEFGASKSIAFDESTSTIRLVIQSLKADEEERKKQQAFLDRVVSWLEEKNGMASWPEFLETFPSFPKKDRVDWLAMIKSSHDELVFAPTESLIVLRPMADRAFTSLFREYLRGVKGNKVVPATKFAHFVETFPGALQIRDRLSPNDAKLASLAKKFPDKVHFWREGDAAMCCLAEEREGIEQERAEKRRKEAEAKAEIERKRLQQEKREQEEKASMEWERRKREMMMMTTSQSSTPSDTPPQVPAPSLVQPLASKRQRWGEPVPSPAIANATGGGGSNAAPMTIPDQSLPPPSYSAPVHRPPAQHANNPPSAQPPPIFAPHAGPSYDAYTPEMAYYPPPPQTVHHPPQPQPQPHPPPSFRPPPLVPHLSAPSPMPQPSHPHYPPPQFPQPPPSQQPQQDYSGGYPYQPPPHPHPPPPPHSGYGGYGYNNDGRG